ncbi:carbon storage regulator [Planctomicrobium piriforme]|uniref:Translational regulator CsrA n=1 Tax=Planctomicrobium piriforme TaxID=1576369 RepID=A0A1I3G4M7_9PLAN|nr:carbon storage regulator [Planctomicrobium piriforme]SFI18212.1 carbon storage regulator (csrA) [Planctomicrobium piriforme]
MLVISRKSEEFLKIGDDIVIKVIKTSNGSVKIGIEAPGGLRVLRGELLEAVCDLPKSSSRNRTARYRDFADQERVQPVEAV